MTTSNHAAIDIGTNSIHLLVAAVGEDGDFTVLTTEKETVRLGEAPGDITELSAAAIDRGIGALTRFGAIARSHDAEIIAVATSAVREAGNGHEFVERARAEAGVEVEVIAGPAEARLIHLGVLQALPVFEQQVLVVDIGGGSTELLVGRAGRVLDARSLRLGHLRLTNRFFPGGVITAEAVAECRDFVRTWIAPDAHEMEPLGHQIAVGCSGTITELGDLIRLRTVGETAGPGLDTVVDRRGLESVIDELTAWPTAEQRAEHVSGLSAKRADVIVAGALLLHEIFRAFDIDTMVTSPYALREGVLFDRTLGIEAGAERLADLRRDSLLRTVQLFEEDPSDVKHAAALSLALFDELADLHGYASAERELLEAGALLHNVGVSISHANHHRHSEYVIRHSDRLIGYTEREIEIIAQVARYHRHSEPKLKHQAFADLAEADRERVCWMAGILRVAIGLDRTQQRVVQGVTARTSDEGVIVDALVGDHADAAVELFTANDRSDLLASVAGRAVHIVARS